MRQVTCGKCNQTVPMQKSFVLAGETLCEACCGEAGRNAARTPSARSVRQVDPTICQRCGKDTSATLPTIANMRLCPDCTETANNFPFPHWVKIAAIGLAALVAFSTHRNLRFVQGYLEYNSAMTAIFQQHDFNRGEQLTYAAYGHVPECRLFEAMAAYFLGVNALDDENNQGAVALFQNADEILSEGFEKLSEALSIGFWLHQAKIGEAFDDKDYDLCLSLAVEAGERYPENSYSQGSLTSAYACKYAVTGNPEFREKALQSLGKQGTLVGTNQTKYIRFEQRILHSLETREILSRKAFLEKFPDGWKKQEEAA